MKTRLRYVPSGCATAGILHEEGKLMSGELIVRAIATMHERSNGLGGGFAGYGIYPEMKDYYAFHVLYDRESNRQEVEEFLSSQMFLVRSERINIRPTPKIGLAPVLWRYFLQVPEAARGVETEEDYVVRVVMRINLEMPGAYVISSGKNMGVFKGVGYPEDIAEFFRLEEYKAYLWIAHARFPTNTVAWWGGAHPFSLLDWSVVHNGEISSYGINKRYVEMFGYRCTLKTDTEVLVYLLDLLVRRQGLPWPMVFAVLAPPFWEQIERMRLPEKRAAYTALRQVYGSALANGPFSILIGHKRGLIGLTDRIKLRPLVAARNGNMVFMASEEAAIHAICPGPLEFITPKAGFPAEGRLREEVAV
ncbi:MAG: class II glutamine amidotransferase [Anaerolineae bacterium]